MQKKIIASAVISVIVTLLSLWIISNLIIHNSIRRSLDRRSDLAVILASYTDNLLQSNLTRLYDISISGSIDLNDDNWEPENMALRTAYQYSIFTDGIFLVDLEGNVAVTYPPGQINRKNLGNVTYVRRALEEKKAVISSIYTDADTGRKVIYVLVPLKDRNGNIVGAAGGEINPTNYILNNIIRAVPTSGNTIIELVDSYGYVIASNNPIRVFTCSEHDKILGNLISTQKKTVMKCHRCHEGEGGLKDIDREKITDMLAFSPLTEAPWGICVREPEKLVFEPSSDLKKKFLMLGFISTGSALIFALGLSKSIVNPIKFLIKAANRIAEGNLQEPVRSVSRDEIGVLSERFEIMRGRLSESLDNISRHNSELEKRVAERTYELQLNRQRLAMLLDEIIEAQEEERKRVARELHDEISQLLAALGMSIDIAGLAHMENNLTAEGIGELKLKVEHILDSINLIIRDLRPPVLDDLGLESAIRWLLQRHLLDKGINFYLIISDDFKKLMAHYVLIAATERKTELMLFRVVQEAVINIAKHSSAKNAFVFLESRNCSVQIGIEDDGVGFDLKCVYTNTNSDTDVRFGLLGIRERVSLLGGRLHICSNLDSGTFINVNVPWSSLGVTDV